MVSLRGGNFLLKGVEMKVIELTLNTERKISMVVDKIATISPTNLYNANCVIEAWYEEVKKMLERSL